MTLGQTTDPLWSYTFEARMEGHDLVSKIWTPTCLQQSLQTTASIVFIMSSFSSVIFFPREHEISDVVVEASLLGSGV